MSIDYGMGLTNIDHTTGIRYGVISQNDVLQAWAGSSEAHYGDPTCPQCGDSVADTSGHGDDEYDQYGHGCADYVCHSCKHTLDSSDVYGDEPLGFTYDDDGYFAEQSGNNGFGIFVLESPFYTYAPFCSPCAPGAGDLNNASDKEIPRDDTGRFIVGNLRFGFESQALAESYGPKTYCFGHDWFDDGKAPYRVFRVSDDSEVMPEGKG